MASEKISALASLGTAPSATDLLVLVDVSDTTMAPTGTTKNMTIADLESYISAWKLNGNTVGSEKWIGTADNFALPFRTNNVEVGRFSTAGNLGIGLSTLTARLHVQGSGSTSATFGLKVQNSSSALSLQVRDDGNSIFMGGTTQYDNTVRIENNAVNGESLRLSGASFYTGGPSNNDGISLLIGYNTGGNRQLWIADSASLTPNATNATLAINVGGTVTPSIQGTSTNGSVLNIGMQTAGGKIGIGATFTPTATVHVQGSGSTSTTYTAKFQNSSSAAIFDLRDDGVSIFGGAAKLKSYTVATLPAGEVGMIAYVTDALLPTFLVIIAGGGAVTTPVFYNGANWVAF